MPLVAELNGVPTSPQLGRESEMREAASSRLLLFASEM